VKTSGDIHELTTGRECMTLIHEIHEQPEVLNTLLDSQMGAASLIADAIRQRKPSYVYLAARGSSDNAGIYAKYLLGSFNGLPVAMATPSLFTLYDRHLFLKDGLILGISQSGQSPDIVKVLEEGHRQGALTAAITNVTDSPLAQSADFVLDICAGQEKAVAATKTYTASLMAVAMLVAALADDPAMHDELSRISTAVQMALDVEDKVARATERFRYMTHCVVLGRGYNYANAFEWALKLKELTYCVAQPYSTADFRHGPIAMVEPGFPIMAIAPHGAVFPDMEGLLARLNNDLRAELVVISDDEAALAQAKAPLPLSRNIPEWATPIVSIVLAQLFCYHLTQVKGFDPDAPRSLNKVTRTL
jgi:glucosamine--fructose-6-phosphate aminotransferase (isomerizing)